MGKPLRALVVEDSEDDALLLLRELRRGGYEPAWRRVDTGEAMHTALDREAWDIVFADYSMPEFSALAALTLLQEREIDLPFLIISGTVGEETAVTALKAGAHDFLRKDQLARLIPAIERELREADERRAGRLTQEKLQMAQQQAVAQERLAAVGQLAAGIAHDFNNLLGTIILYGELILESSPLKPVDRERMGTLLQQAEHGSSLVAQILDFGRRSFINRSPMDLTAFLRQAHQLLQRTLPENIRLKIELGDEPRVVSGDPARLQQVLLNLALNARDAMPEGGELLLAIEAMEVGPGAAPFPDMVAGMWVLFRVSDTGTGIPEEILPRVFEPFFTTKPPGEGSGLGLSQVYGIVKQHDGFIRVESQKGAGTSIGILLPLLPDQSVPGLVRLEVESLSGSGETILLVEDEDPLREAIYETLTSLGYRVIQAADGYQALTQLETEEESIHLVLTDKIMPGLGGVELYRRIRQIYPELPVLLMSAYTQGAVTRELIERDGLEWIQKPVNTDSLARAIRGLLERSN